MLSSSKQSGSVIALMLRYRITPWRAVKLKRLLDAIDEYAREVRALHQQQTAFAQSVASTDSAMARFLR